MSASLPSTPHSRDCGLWTQRSMAPAFTTTVRQPFSRDGENRTRVVLVPNQVGGHCPTPR